MCSVPVTSTTARGGTVIDVALAAAFAGDYVVLVVPAAAAVSGSE